MNGHNIRNCRGFKSDRRRSTLKPFEIKTFFTATFNFKLRNLLVLYPDNYKTDIDLFFLFGNMTYQAVAEHSNTNWHRGFDMFEDEAINFAWNPLRKDILDDKFVNLNSNIFVLYPDHQHYHSEGLVTVAGNMKCFDKTHHTNDRATIPACTSRETF